MAVAVNDDDDDVVHKEQNMDEKESSPKLMQEVVLKMSWPKTLIDIAAPKEWVSEAFLNPHVPFHPPRASYTFLS